MFPKTVSQILALNLDPPTVIAACEMLRGAGWGIGSIADHIRKYPPVKGQPYAKPEPTRPLQPDHAPDQPRRHPMAARLKGNPTGGAELRDPGWMEREIAKAERGEL